MDGWRHIECIVGVTFLSSLPQFWWLHLLPLEGDSALVCYKRLFSIVPLQKRYAFKSTHILDHVWANCGPGATCGPLGFLFWPAEESHTITIFH